MITKRFFKTKDEVEVTFDVDRPGVESAAVVGEWNDWQPAPMERSHRGKGPFRFKLRLPKGRSFQFRYLFDGTAWDNDEAADGYRQNEYGSDNSLISTG